MHSKKFRSVFLNITCKKTFFCNILIMFEKILEQSGHKTVLTDKRTNRQRYSCRAPTYSCKTQNKVVYRKIAHYFIWLYREIVLTKHASFCEKMKKVHKKLTLNTEHLKCDTIKAYLVCLSLNDLWRIGIQWR